MKASRMVFSLLFMAFSSFQALANTLPNDRPLYMVVFGDSITRGVMADAQMGKPNPRFYSDMFVGYAAINFYQTLGKVFGIVEPSEDDILFIEKNFSHMSRLNLSAFVGSQPYSLAQRLEQATSYRPNVYNGAVLAAGYHTSDILLTRFERHQRNNKHRQNPDIVMVNFNGMDFINNIGLENFTKDVSRFFKRLKKLAPSATIFVTDLSNPVPLLTAPNRVAAPRNLILPKDITCHDLYRQLRFGAKAGLTPDSTPEEIAAAAARLEEMRTILADQIDSVNQNHNAGQVVLIKDILGSDGSDPVTHLAADCIHPYVTGQRIIGDTLWNTVSDYVY